MEKSKTTTAWLLRMKNTDNVFVMYGAHGNFPISFRSRAAARTNAEYYSRVLKGNYEPVKAVVTVSVEVVDKGEEASDA